MSDQEPDQGLPGDGEDGDGDGTDEPTEDDSEPEAIAPPLATDPVLTNAIDVPTLGRAVDAGEVDAISSAQAAALATQEQASS